MRRDDFAAVAAQTVRRWCARIEPASDKNVPFAAVGALVAGMLVSVSLLAATDSNAPDVQDEMPAVMAAAPEVDDEFEQGGGLPIGSQNDDAFSSFENEAPAAQADEIRWFNNRPIRPVGTMRMLVTAYSPDEQSCGEWADGFTASGYSVWTNGMKLVAADTSILPFGSLVSIPGYDAGNVVPVLDRGGAIKGNRLDVLYPTHERALEWGVQRLEVTIWEYADGEPSGFRQQHHRR